MLGTAETVGEQAELFQLVDRANKVYAKKAAAKGPHLHFTADKVGTYEGQCGEFCGYEHPQMLATVESMPNGDFQSWYDKEAQAQASTILPGPSYSVVAFERAELDKTNPNLRRPRMPIAERYSLFVDPVNRLALVRRSSETTWRRGTLLV